MSTNSPMLWPAQDLKDGYLYGWTHPLTCVAGVLQADTRDIANQALQEALASDEWTSIQTLGIGTPTILGQCSFSRSQIGISELAKLELESDAGLRYRGPVRPSVLYQRPDRNAMQFYSLDHGELNILPSQTSIQPSTPVSGAATAILTHDFTRPTSNMHPMFDATVLNQINIAESLAAIVDRKCSTLDQVPKRSISPTPPAEDPSKVHIGVNIREASESDTRQRIMRALAVVMSRLRDLSATMEQLDVRMEQGSFVWAHSRIIARRNNSRSAESISRYVKFYNCIWLVLNDIIIGVAFGSFLCENNMALAQMLHAYAEYYLIECMQHALLWLNNWPAGLKLNTELSQFYCHTLLGVIFIWRGILHHVAPYFPALFWIVGATGCCGMTMIVSLLSDALNLLTVHLYLCYFLVTSALSQQLSLIGSLWNLFRGKRFNVLRNRLDSWDYDMDQLLLGTILFTLLAFLYPTVLTYYALFAMTHLAIIMLHAALDTISALLNHFPLFALMLRAKDPLRLPGCISFRRLREQDGLLVLENQPAPLSSVFMHYAQLWSRLSSHYHPIRLLRQLMSGSELTPIPRSMIRFSMVPARSPEEQ